MSSFFRSASENSESEETSTSSRYSPSSNSSSSRTGELVTRSQPSIGPSQHHQNVLVHALLEDKCLNDVCQELNASCPTASRRKYTKDDPEVKLQAAERYRLLSAQLVSHGLINGGPEDDSFTSVRQTARDGLSMLSQQLNVMDLSAEDSELCFAAERPRVGQPARKLLEAPGDSASPWKAAGYAPESSTVPRNLHLAQLLPSHPLLDSTRYSRDFEEIRMLGKGGYGSVYHVTHRLDGRSYAVKKIRLGPEVLSRVQQNGESELNAILRELRTMARLEHANIVRYFGGWVEWTKDTDPIGSTNSSQPRLITQDSSASDSSTSSLSPPSLSAPSASDGIEFGLSSGPPLARIPSATASDPSNDDMTNPIEDIPRPARSLPPSPGPSLTLHIQMSLYPLTLSTYLSPPLPSQPRHCHHLAPSLRIFAQILAGVSHLHAAGIAHRDLKPANIFLCPVPPLRQGSCDGCGPPWHVCVGDLGLVTETATTGHGVGTALYRPAEAGGAAEQDLYALAVVLVELCVPFGTRMERGRVLGAMKEGVVPRCGTGVDEVVGSLVAGEGGVEGCRVKVERLLREMQHTQAGAGHGDHEDI